ncbi:MAG: hypothetical protein OEZ68_02330 [Gammaproteobacteria bacterium]|nr:hypothetical protein [Gammaproteobacteria bacterium]MDH5799619.1 hypothetical protein [Gammaproteobacteria bacterium]
MEIRYRFVANGGLSIEQVVQLGSGANDLATEAYPQWVQLDYRQCHHCTLTPKQTPWCPVARNIFHAVTDCAQLASYDALELEVQTPQRTYNAATTAQKALCSFFGLVIGTSDCPHTAFFKPMAQFHLPLSTKEESIFRVAGTYFISEYFRGSDHFNIDRLLAVYANLQTVNEHIAKRIGDIPGGDASRNAVVLLHMLSCVLPLSLKDDLKELERYFN